MASTSRRRPRPCTAAAISRSGFSTPVVVSQCTTATPAIDGSRSMARPTSSGATGFAGADRSATCGMSAICAISIMRAPYAPLSTMRSVPPRGAKVRSTASTAYVPPPGSPTAS